MPFDGLSSKVQRPTSVREKNRRFTHCKLAQKRHKRRFTFFSRSPSELDLLTSAHQLLRNVDDWTQGCLVDDTGRLCSIGALYVATYRHGITVSHPSYARALVALHEQSHVLGWSGGSFDKFNDSSPYTEVMLAFQLAISAVGGQHAV
jgi:hypothetical protein